MNISGVGFSNVSGILKAAIARFPLSSLCVLIISAVAFVIALDPEILKSSETIKCLLELASIGFLVYGLIDLCAEYYGWAKKSKWVLYAVSTALFVGAVYSLKTSDLLIARGGLLLWLFAMPFAGRKNSDDDFWQYSYLFARAIIISVIIGVILNAAIGVVAGLASYLLGVPLLYHYFLPVVIGFSMFIGLFMVPMTKAEACLGFSYKKVELLALNAVFIPLMMALVVLTHLYGGLILLNGELPKGGLAMIGVGTALFGYVVWWATYPVRDDSDYYRQFYKYYFAVMIVPLVLAWVAIYRRISEYGVTFDRYYVVVCCVLLSVFILANLGRVRLKAQHFLVIAGGLLILSVMGPWSARNVTQDSQIRILDQLLAEHKILVDGKVNAEFDLAALDKNDRNRILNIINYMGTKKILEGYAVEGRRFEKSYDFIQYVGMDANTSPLRGVQTSTFSANINHIAKVKNLRVAGYDYIFDFSYYEHNKAARVLGAEGLPEIKYEIAETKLVLNKGTGKELVFDLAPAVGKAKPQEEGKGDKKVTVNWDAPVIIEARNGNTRGKLFVRTIHGRSGEDVTLITGIKAVLLYKE